jgi:hypothetical protein
VLQVLLHRSLREQRCLLLKHCLLYLKSQLEQEEVPLEEQWPGGQRAPMPIASAILVDSCRSAVHCFWNLPQAV